jgi:hypothetical protein
MNKELLTVVGYIETQIKKHCPEIKNEDLCDNGAIYYMNGNDGTDFDWDWNNRVCEFMKFYKSNEYGLIKVFVNRNGIIDGYIYKEEGKGKAIELEPINIGESQARAFKKYLMENYDKKGLWDSIVG